MTTLQEQFEKDFPDKNMRMISIDISEKYQNTNFTNYDLDLSEYVNWDFTSFHCSHNNLTYFNVSNLVDLGAIFCPNNNLTSVDFLKTIPNPEKLERIFIYNNNIQPTDIAVFSRFVNLHTLKIGTMSNYLEKGKRNKFYGSFESWKNLSKLEEICIEATDVDSGLEFLPMSLVEAIKKQQQILRYSKIECSPHNTSAKCKAIQDALRPYDYDLEAWQLAHPQKMYVAQPQLFEQAESRDKWLNAVIAKIEKTQSKLREIQQNESDKVKKIKRLKSKIRELELIKKLTEERQIFEDSLSAGVRWYDKFKEDKSTQTDLIVEQTQFLHKKHHNG